MKRRRRPAPQAPTASLLPFTVVQKTPIWDDTPGRAYPSKIYIEFRNNTAESAVISPLLWVSGIKAELFHHVLQVRLAQDWFPIPDGTDSLLVTPGETFRLWVAPDKIYSRDTVQRLCAQGQVGTLTLLINNRVRQFAV